MPTASDRVCCEHNRAHLAWLESIVNKYPDLIIENCGSGGGRMDYAMLSRLQMQSMTDQENYLESASDPGRLVRGGIAGATRNLDLPTGQCGCRSSQL